MVSTLFFPSCQNILSWYNITWRVSWQTAWIFISVTLIIFYTSLQSVRGQCFWCIFHVVVSMVSKNCHINFFLYNFHLQDFIFWGASLVRWWEHSPPTNVSQVQILAFTLYMDDDFVVGFLRSLFLRGFSPRILTGIPLFSKTNTSKFQFDLEHTDTFKRVL